MSFGNLTPVLIRNIPLMYFREVQGSFLFWHYQKSTEVSFQLLLTEGCAFFQYIMILIVNSINRIKYIFRKKRDGKHYFQQYILTYFQKSVFKVNSSTRFFFYKQRFFLNSASALLILFMN